MKNPLIALHSNGRKAKHSKSIATPEKKRGDTLDVVRELKSKAAVLVPVQQIHGSSFVHLQHWMITSGSSADLNVLQWAANYITQHEGCEIRLRPIPAEVSQGEAALDTVLQIQIISLGVNIDPSDLLPSLDWSEQFDELSKEGHIGVIDPDIALVANIITEEQYQSVKERIQAPVHLSQDAVQWENDKPTAS